MKQLLLTIVFLILFISCSQPEPVEFPDPNLAAAVREALKLETDAPIMDTHLKKLDSLMAIDRGKCR